MKVKRFAIASVLALGLALILAWLLAGAPIPRAQAAPHSPTANVIYGNETLRFVNQVVTGPMSRPGDSGSAILDEQKRVVGLLFSGSDYATIFTPISFVLAALDIEVITA